MTPITQPKDILNQLRLPQRNQRATEAPVKEPPPDRSIPSSPKPTRPVVPVEPMRIIPPSERPDECPDTANPQCPVS